MDKNITLIANNLEISKEIKRILKKKFENAGYTTSDDVRDNTELVISIGGDGSFLRAVRELGFPEIPFFCINTGHLGFFAEILPDEQEICYFIDSFINSNYKINELTLLEIEMVKDGNKKRDYAINELVVRGNRSRTCHLDLFVNGDFMETFSGDGLIISTATGSTAYNYSAGGSIVDNRLKIMQITPISPISTNAFRSFTSSIILPGEDSIVSIKPEYRNENSVILVIDGEEMKHDRLDIIRTRTSNKKVKLLKLRDFEFWDRVYMKFLKTYDFKASELKTRREKDIDFNKGGCK